MNEPRNRSAHANLGRSWERELEAVHDLYRLEGKADVVKNPNDWTFITQRQHEKQRFKYGPGYFAKTMDGKYMMRSQSDVDFSGGGKNFSVCFDAKHCEAKTFPISSMAEHQIHRLRQSARCGAIAGFMLQMVMFDRVFFIPVKYADDRMMAYRRQRVGGRAKAGTASISLSDLVNNCVEIPRSRAGIRDWLPILTGAI